MVDTVEQGNLRGLETDKVVKGFALVEYVFKNLCTVSPMSSDSIRWYTETAADLTATSPAAIKDVSPLSTFPFLETSWTRNTSYYKKYAAEGFISLEDQKADDVDVLVRSLLRLTRAVVKQVDTDIYGVMADSYPTAQAVPSNINSVAANAPWNGTGARNPIEDIMDAKSQIWIDNYNPESGVLLLSPTDYSNLVSYLIVSGGSNIPVWSSAKVQTGQVTEILGLKIIVSNNVSASGALVMIPQKTTTWRSFTDTTSRLIEDPGIGTKIRVWEAGVAYNTDPLSACLIYNTQTHL